MTDIKQQNDHGNEEQEHTLMKAVINAAINQTVYVFCDIRG